MAQIVGKKTGIEKDFPGTKSGFDKNEVSLTLSRAIRLNDAANLQTIYPSK